MALADYFYPEGSTEAQQKQLGMQMLLSQLAGIGQASAPSRIPANMGQIMASGLGGLLEGQRHGLVNLRMGQTMADEENKRKLQAELRKQLSAVPTTTKQQVPLEPYNLQGLGVFRPGATQEVSIPRERLDILKDQMGIYSKIAGDPFKEAEGLKDIASLQRGASPSDTQISEIPINGKMHSVLISKPGGEIVKDYGEKIESFKPKNIIGRGWISKRPIMQSNEYGGAAVYADTKSGEAPELVPSEDSRMLRPVTIKGLEAAQVDTLAGLKNTYDRLSVVEEKFNDPKYAAKTGPLTGRWNALKVKFANEGETQSVINELKSLITIAYGLSGKQISKEEMTMLQDAMLPRLEQPGENILATIAFAKNWVGNLHNDKVGYFEKAGYDVEIPQLKPREKKNKQEAPAKVETKGKIKVKSPDGRTGFVPASQLKDALSQGYTRVD